MRVVGLSCFPRLPLVKIRNEDPVKIHILALRTLFFGYSTITQTEIEW